VFVDVDEMRVGANASYNASALAGGGKHNLSRANVSAGMFGTFVIADSFLSGIRGARDQHMSRLGGHETRLADLGDNAHVAASSFVDMEARNKAALKAVAWPPTRT
jgi:hypothetical protein